MAADRSNRGFSLVELLLVLMILGLGVSLVSLSIGGDESARQLRRTAEQFSALAKLATDEAVLGGEPIGLGIIPADVGTPWQYYWQRYRDGIWQAEEEPLDPKVLSPDISMEVEIEGRPVDWTLSQENKATDLPLIVFYPSGEATIFSLMFFSESAPEERQQVKGSISGQIKWLDGIEDGS